MDVEISNAHVEYVAGSYPRDDRPDDPCEEWTEIDDIFHNSAPVIGDELVIEVDGEDYVIDESQIIRKKKDLEGRHEGLSVFRQPIADYYKNWRDTHNDPDTDLFEGISEEKGTTFYTLDIEDEFDPKKVIVLALEIITTKQWMVYSMLYEHDGKLVKFEFEDTESRGVSLTCYENQEQL